MKTENKINNHAITRDIFQPFKNSTNGTLTVQQILDLEEHIDNLVDNLECNEKAYNTLHDNCKKVILTVECREKHVKVVLNKNSKLICDEEFMTKLRHGINNKIITFYQTIEEGLPELLLKHKDNLKDLHEGLHSYTVHNGLNFINLDDLKAELYEYYNKQIDLFVNKTKTRIENAKELVKINDSLKQDITILQYKLATTEANYDKKHELNININTQLELKIDYIKQLEARGFWSRLFNVKPKQILTVK